MKLQFIPIRATSTVDLATFIALEKRIVADLKKRRLSRIFSTTIEPIEARRFLKSSKAYFVVQGKKIVGVIAHEQKGPGHIHISEVMTDPDYQGNKIATTALRTMLKRFRSETRVDLTTHKINSPALVVYLKLGFEIESLRENFYGDGEPRLIMVWKHRGRID